MTKRLLFILLTLFFAFAAQIIADKNKAAKFHPAGMPCTNCHISADNITQNNAGQLLATQEKLCSSCHENALKVSHPSGLIPSMKTPDIFPLDWKHELTCSSCHNIHSVSRSTIRGNLRGKKLCLSCHNMAFFRAMTDDGISLQQSIHKNKSNNNFSSVDSYSLECLNCHANQGDNNSVAISDRGIVKHSSGAVNHPVGMLYRDAKSRGSYKEISKISTNIILPDGKVSCISCHKGYSKKHGEMIDTKSTTALCLECHDM